MRENRKHAKCLLNNLALINQIELNENKEHNHNSHLNSFALLQKRNKCEKEFQAECSQA